MFKKAKNIVYRCAEILILALLILAALYVSIGRILMGSVGDFADNLETFLSDRLDTPVSIGRLEGNWSYLDPGFVVHDFVVGKSERPGIALKNVAFRLDTVASLVERNPVVSELEIDGLNVMVVQDASGRWRISSVPRKEGRGIDTELLLDSLPHLKLVSLKDIEVELLGQRSTYRIATETRKPFRLVSDAGVKSLSLPLMVERTAENDETTVEQMELIGRYEGDPRDKSGFSTRLYFQLPSIDLTDFLVDPAFNDVALTRMAVNGEFWFEFSDQAFSFAGRPVVSKVRLSAGDRTLDAISNFTTEFRLSGPSFEQCYLHVGDVSARVASQSITLGKANITVKDRRLIAGHIPQVKLGPLGEALAEVGGKLGLIRERGLKTLKDMHPQGTLEDILFTADADEARAGIKITARVRDASINAHRGSPAIDNLHGFLSAGPDRGYVDIVNEETRLEFARMFDEPWHFDSARGRITYDYQPGFVQISSGLLEVTKDDLLARGKLHLNLPRDRRRQTWGLVVGIEDASLESLPRYLPNIMPETVRTWLGDSLLTGKVRESGLVFHGSLNRQAPKIEKVHQLYFKVDEVVLDYDPKWPRLNDLNATVYVANSGVYSDDASGRIYDSRIYSGTVRVPMDPEGGADLINIKADVKGPLSAGVRLFNASPLEQITNDMAEGWQARGDMTGTVGLGIPIGERAGEEIRTEVSVTFGDNDIYMPRYDLNVADIGGSLKYTNDGGVVSDNLAAVLFDRPITGSIESVIQDDGGEIIVNLDGDVDVADLQSWSNQLLLTRASGMLAYDAALHIPFGDRRSEHNYVEATSNLGGVTIDLPPPMGKAPDGEMPLLYRQTFLEPGYRVELALGDQVKGVLKIADGVAQGGHIRYGTAPLGAVAFDRIKVTGRLDVVDYDQWATLAEDLETRSEVSFSSQLATRLDVIDVDIGRLNAFGLVLDEVQAEMTRQQDRWHLRLDDNMLAGSFDIPDNEEAPLDVNLDYVRFDSDEELAGDPLADVSPVDMIAVDFITREFSVDGEDYGSWRFEMRPTEDGVALKNLTAAVKGLRVVTPSTVRWETVDDGTVSFFKGNVVTDDLGGALEQWGYVPSIEGENFRFHGDFKWSGSPAMISVDAIKGKVMIVDGRGRFVQAESADALKMLGIFDFASLARRMRFDFSDIVKEGYSFGKIKGATRFNHGVVNIIDPIVIEGASSILKMGGTINLNTGELDNEMIVTLPVNRNLPWYAAYSAIATGPLMGAGVILAQKIFESQIDQMSSAKYSVTGTLDTPKIEFVSIFSDGMREADLEEESSQQAQQETAP